MYSSLTTWMIDKSTIRYVFMNCSGHIALLNIGENNRERIKMLKIGWQRSLVLSIFQHISCPFLAKI